MQRENHNQMFENVNLFNFSVTFMFKSFLNLHYINGNTSDNNTQEKIIHCTINLINFELYNFLFFIYI